MKSSFTLSRGLLARPAVSSVVGAGGSCSCVTGWLFRPVVARRRHPATSGRIQFCANGVESARGDRPRHFPGRVVWARDHWPLIGPDTGGRNPTNGGSMPTRTRRGVDAMFNATLLALTGTTSAAQSWQAIFEYYNRTARQLDHRGYQPGEVVAIKINLNNSDAAKADNYTDESPQMVLATVRQLVNSAHVRPEDVLIYDVRRDMPPYLLTKVWSEFKDVRFIQNAPQRTASQEPGLRDHHGLEAADWCPESSTPTANTGG